MIVKITLREAVTAEGWNGSIHSFKMVLILNHVRVIVNTWQSASKNMKAFALSLIISLFFRQLSMFGRCQYVEDSYLWLGDASM